MLAIFGEITFELISGPLTMNQDYRWEYAAHRVIDGAPNLQWIGKGITKLSLDMRLHRSFTDPKAQLEALLRAATDHRARPLIFGNGDLRGYFVISGLNLTYEQLGAQGDVLAIEVQAELSEMDLSGAIGQGSSTTDFTPIAAQIGGPAAETGPIAASLPLGVSQDTLPAMDGYTTTSLAVRGTSPLIASQPGMVAPSGAINPDDIPLSRIVRTTL